MKLTASHRLLSALLTLPVFAHAQLVKLYVARPRELVQAGPLKARTVHHLIGYLHAGDSVQLDTSRGLHSTRPDDERLYRQYVGVWYPPAPDMPAGGGWVARKFLVSRRDSVGKR